MGRTITEIKVGGAMLALAYDAYALSLQMVQYSPEQATSTQAGLFITSNPWIGILIAFFIFVGLVLWGWGEASWKLRQHESTHPECGGVLRPDGKGVYLDVTNTGHGTGRFRAQVIGWQNVSLSPKMDGPYKLRWLNNLNNPTSRTYELIPGESNRLLVAETNGHHGSKQQHMNILVPAIENLNREAIVPIGVNLHVTIELAAEPLLTSRFKRTYVLAVTENETWEVLGQN